MGEEKKLEKELENKHDTKAGLFPRARSEELNAVTNSRTYDVMPSSPALNMSSKILNKTGKTSGSAVPKGNGKYKITVRPYGVNKKGVVFEGEKKTKSGGNYKVSMDFEDSSILGKNSKGLKKFFVFSLIQCNNQNYSKTVSFPLKALVECGMYKTIDTARRGARDNIEKIKGITFGGKIYDRGGRVIEEQGGNLIYHHIIKNNCVTLFINENFNIDLFAEYFTIFPRTAYALGTKAFSLLERIFVLARMNTKAIKETGGFNIGLRAIRDHLALPDESETKFHTRKIRQPIEDAIEEIETLLSDHEFTITPMIDGYLQIEEDMPVTDWLNGYLRIEFSGEFYKRFVDIANRTQRKIESNKRKKKG